MDAGAYGGAAPNADAWHSEQGIAIAWFPDYRGDCKEAKVCSLLSVNKQGKNILLRTTPAYLWQASQLFANHVQELTALGTCTSAEVEWKYLSRELKVNCVPPHVEQFTEDFPKNAYRGTSLALENIVPVRVLPGNIAGTEGLVTGIKYIVDNLTVPNQCLIVMCDVGIYWRWMKVICANEFLAALNNM